MSPVYNHMAAQILYQMPLDVYLQYGAENLIDEASTCQGPFQLSSWTLVLKVAPGQRGCIWVHIRRKGPLVRGCGDNHTWPLSPANISCTCINMVPVENPTNQVSTCQGPFHSAGNCPAGTPRGNSWNNKENRLLIRCHFMHKLCIRNMCCWISHRWGVNLSRPFSIVQLGLGVKSCPRPKRMHLSAYQWSCKRLWR